jgi:hypothetical protein
MVPPASLSLISSIYRSIFFFSWRFFWDIRVQPRYAGFNPRRILVTSLSFCISQVILFEHITYIHSIQLHLFMISHY